MEFNLKKILKALLFSSSQWLSIKDIQNVIVRYNKEMETSKLQNNELSKEFSQENSATNYENQATMQDLIKQVPTILTATQIREAIEEIKAQLIEDNDVYTLIQGPTGWKVALSEDYSQWVRLLRNDPKPQKLSQAALETLAIVAYRQPVTRAEVESIRGVNADGAINRLLDRELIYISGRADLPGRPLQYATNEKFLEYIGISSIDELPSSDVLSPKQISTWIKNANNPELFTDKEMGLSPSEIEIEENNAEDISQENIELDENATLEENIIEKK
ncbi:MAG: SMC-Scp complex subunit ScpB [Opitutales bacterium]